jgi:FkbM family methyltransferase
VLAGVLTGLRCVAYGARWSDRLAVAARLGLYPLFPLGSLARRVGHPLPDPSRWLGPYRLHCPAGIFECPPGPGPFFLAADRTYEPALAALLQTLEGGTFVDVGANVGFITVRAARSLGQRGRVIAVEAHPVRFEFLQRNLRLNRLSNVRAVACALGAEEGMASLYDVDPTLGPRPRDASLLRPARGRAFDVRLRTLDAVLAELGDPADVSLVKIDVEGYESRVLQGMARTLEQQPRVVFEALDGAALEAARRVLPAGYRVERLEGANYLATPAA